MMMRTSEGRFKKDLHGGWAGESGGGRVGWCAVESMIFAVAELGHDGQVMTLYEAGGS